ncbi:hypothetical protein B1207_02500 [Legionella quinlivanii]|uniref:Cyanophycinase n=1 Tax=Legionella quinlivanii TaxID=45073 RepID=A0A364LLX8_9GAMM|nr:cyanophycinase [Legionella quinlivanii]RAP37878.1 hypothetical protein B1207_02500 [Legionella quinlivanii]
MLLPLGSFSCLIIISSNIWVKTRFKRDKVCIAGTSAGSMIMSQKMIASGSNAEAQADEDLELSTGLNLLPQTLVDTHFIERGGFARLAHAIDQYPHLLGISIEADTAILVDEHFATTYGSGTITFIDGHCIKDYKHSPENQCVINLNVHLLVSGCQFDLKQLQLIVK